MPIELRCSQCDTLLRVPDGSAGRETRCPSCQTMLSIPDPESPPTPATPPTPVAGAAPAGTTAGPESRSAEQEANPFAAPTTEPQVYGAGMSPFQSDDPGFEGAPRLLIGEVLGTALRLYGRNFLACFFGAAVTAWLPALVVLAFFFAVLGTMGPRGPESPFLIFAAVIPAIPLSAWLYAGMMQMSLRAGRQGTTQFKEMFRTGGVFLSVLLASFFLFMLFFLIAMGFGFIASFVMMAIWDMGVIEASMILQMFVILVLGALCGVLFSQTFWLIVDRKAGPWAALGKSIEMTKGFRLKLLVLVAVCLGAILITSVIPLLSIVLQPLLYGFMSLLWACVYLSLTGRPIAGDSLSLPGAVSVAAPSGEMHGLSDVSPPSPPSPPSAE